MSTSARSWASHARCSSPTAKGFLSSFAETRAGEHASHRRELAGGPKIRSEDAVQHHEVYALVVEGVTIGAEPLPPGLAHVQVPVVFADHHLDRGLERAEYLRSELELRGLAELREVAAEEHKIGGGILGVDVVDRAEERADKSLVDLPVVEMRVADVGEAEGSSSVTGVDLHGLVGMRRSEVHRCRRSEACGRDFEEVAPTEVLKSPEYRYTALLVAGFETLDVGDAGHHLSPPRGKTRSSNPSRWRLADSSSRNGRMEPARLVCTSMAVPWSSRSR